MRSAENTSDLSDGDLIVNYKRKSKPPPVSSSESSDDEDFEAEPPNKQSKSVQESTLLSPPSTSVVDDTDLEHPAHFVLVNDGQMSNDIDEPHSISIPIPDHESNFSFTISQPSAVLSPITSHQHETLSDVGKLNHINI